MSNFTHEIEKHIAKATIKALLAQGWSLSVNDGEETTVDRSVDAAEIFAAMFSTDEDYLLVHRDNSPQQFGWVRFIYGNDGPDVINDYTTNLDEVLAPVNAMAEKLSDGDISPMIPVPLLDRKVRLDGSENVYTVRKFFIDNDGAFEAAEVMLILDALETKGFWLGGGGAAAEWTLRVAEG